jgi:signal transduction histidine kinase
VRADGIPVPQNGPIVLAPGTSRLEFLYAPIQLRSQAGLRFRSLLESFDRGWGPATVEHTADYTNLPSGHYRFRVQTFEVASPDAVTEASIEFEQMPFFYRTWWFLAACAGFAAMLIYGIYQYRVGQVRGRFEAVLDERSRLAREMHDTVIQGCTGVSALLEAVAMEQEAERDAPGLLDVARTQLRGTINEAREAIWNLRRDEEASGTLAEKLAAMAAQVGAEFQVPVHCTVEGSPFSVSPPMAHDLLMVAREAVCNAALHGRPRQVTVQLASARGELLLVVTDDGCGFDLRQAEVQGARHFGL